MCSPARPCARSWAVGFAGCGGSAGAQELVGRKKTIHLDCFDIRLDALERKLVAAAEEDRAKARHAADSERDFPGGPYTLRLLIDRIMSLSRDVRARHAARPAEDYADEATFKRLVQASRRSGARGDGIRDCTVGVARTRDARAPGPTKPHAQMRGLDPVESADGACAGAGRVARRGPPRCVYVGRHAREHECKAMCGAPRAPPECFKLPSQPRAHAPAPGNAWYGDLKSCSRTRACNARAHTHSMNHARRWCTPEHHECSNNQQRQLRETRGLKTGTRTRAQTHATRMHAQHTRVVPLESVGGACVWRRR